MTEITMTEITAYINAHLDVFRPVGLILFSAVWLGWCRWMMRKEPGPVPLSLGF